MNLKIHLFFLILFALENFCISIDFFNSFHNGNPGGTSSQQKRSNQAKSSSADYYSTLGISKDATEQEIKRAYRKKAMVMHPDKGGNAEDFKKLSEAYETLSDPKKKNIYDKYSKDGNNLFGNGDSPFSNANGSPFGSFGSSGGSPFDSFFNGFGAFSMPLVFQLELTLEDLYKGKKLNLPINGNDIELEIEPGMMGGMELMSKGQFVDNRGNPRDLIFRLEEKEHSIYKRKNADLLMDLKISLRDSLLGFEKTIVFLDGSKLKIKSKDGDIIGPNDVLVIENMGMPIYSPNAGNSQHKSRGRLFIQIKLVLPKKSWLTKEDKYILENLLMNDPTSPGKKPSNTNSTPTSSTSKLFSDHLFDTEQATKSSKIGPTPVVPSRSDLKEFGKYGKVRSEYQGNNNHESEFANFFFR
eukprot:gene15695-21233_t